MLGEIDLDPASSDAAQQTVRAARYFTKEDDGLAQQWHGRVFLNPPYGQPSIAHFVTKLIEEVENGRTTAAIMITNNSTDPGWFHDAFLACSAACFTRGRIRFYRTVGYDVCAAPNQGQVFYYFGPDATRFAHRFREVGCIAYPEQS